MATSFKAAYRRFRRQRPVDANNSGTRPPDGLAFDKPDCVFQRPRMHFLPPRAGPIGGLGHDPSHTA
jgi:hypothetical protein